VYVRVPRTWFCPVFHGARHVPSTTGVGRFFPRLHVQPVHGSVYVCVPRTWFCPVFHCARHVPSTTALGRFFTCPRTARSRVRVRACASYMVLPSFPRRASRSVHDARRPFFPVSTYSPFTGPCTCVCVVHGFAQFSKARVTFRPRRASAVFSRVHVQPVHGSVYVRVRRTWFCPVFQGARHVPSTTGVGRFFPCPSTARSRVRVRACASYMVLPSFPWRASRSVHDGRRPFFPVSTYSPFTGPCTCVCVVHGFAQFSMARVTFRPRRASAVFFTCPRTARSRVRVRVRVRPCASYVVLPSFPWRASRSVHDGLRPFFSRVHVQPVQ